MDLITKEYFWGGAFNPKSFAGLQLWFDGADSSTIVFGINPAINTWKDKSGNANNLVQNTVANQPTQDVAVLNGLNAVKIAVANLQFFNLTNPLSLTSGYTAFVVGSRTNTRNLIALGSTTSANAYAPLWFNSGAINSGGTGGTVVSSVNESVTTFNLITTQLNAAENGGLCRFNRSDITGTFNTGTTSPMTSMNEFGATTTVGNMDGDIAEYILYNMVLSPAQIQQVENYLRGKWATP